MSTLREERKTGRWNCAYLQVSFWGPQKKECNTWKICKVIDENTKWMAFRWKSLGTGYYWSRGLRGNGDDAAPQCCARAWGAPSSAGCHGGKKQQYVLADPKAQGRHELLLLIKVYTSVFWRKFQKHSTNSHNNEVFLFNKQYNSSAIGEKLVFNKALNGKLPTGARLLCYPSS